MLKRNLEMETDQLNVTTNLSLSSESPSSEGNVNDVNKKQKVQHNHFNCNHSLESRVVHIRNVPIDATEADLMHVSIPFGRVTNILLLKGKSQALVEFELPVTAQQMVSYWTQTMINGIPTALQPTLRGRNVICQLSNHKELKLNSIANSNNQFNESINNLMNPLQQNSQLNGQSCVLRVVIDNMVYAVSLEIIHSVFSMYKHENFFN